MSFFEYLGKNPLYILIVCSIIILCVVGAVLRWVLVSRAKTKKAKGKDNDKIADTVIDSATENENNIDAEIQGDDINKVNSEKEN